MRRIRKEEMVDRVTENVSKKIDCKERTIFKKDIRVIIDALIEECYIAMLDGNTIVMRGFMTIGLEDRPPVVITSHFHKQSSKHYVCQTKALKIIPSRLFNNAVKERFRVEKDEE